MNEALPVFESLREVTKTIDSLTEQLQTLLTHRTDLDGQIRLLENRIVSLRDLLIRSRLIDHPDKTPSGRVSRVAGDFRREVVGEAIYKFLYANRPTKFYRRQIMAHVPHIAQAGWPGLLKHWAEHHPDKAICHDGGTTKGRRFWVAAEPGQGQA